GPGALGPSPGNPLPKDRDVPVGEDGIGKGGRRGADPRRTAGRRVPPDGRGRGRAVLTRRRAHALDPEGTPLRVERPARRPPEEREAERHDRTADPEARSYPWHPRPP